MLSDFTTVSPNESTWPSVDLSLGFPNPSLFFYPLYCTCSHIISKQGLLKSVFLYLGLQFMHHQKKEEDKNRQICIKLHMLIDVTSEMIFTVRFIQMRKDVAMWPVCLLLSLLLTGDEQLKGLIASSRNNNCLLQKGELSSLKGVMWPCLSQKVIWWLSICMFNTSHTARTYVFTLVSYINWLSLITAIIFDELQLSNMNLYY